MTTFDLKRFTSKEGVSYAIRNGQRIAIKTLEDPPEVAAKARKRKEREEEAFAIVPLWHAALAAEAARSPAILVYVDLMRRARLANGRSFTMPNGSLEKKGVNRKTKLRVLRDFEAYEMITVELRHGKNPRVTMVNM
jgi:hypothetical protein